MESPEVTAALILGVAEAFAPGVLNEILPAPRPMPGRNPEIEAAAQKKRIRRKSRNIALAAKGQSK